MVLISHYSNPAPAHTFDSSSQTRSEEENRQRERYASLLLLLLLTVLSHSSCSPSLCSQICHKALTDMVRLPPHPYQVFLLHFLSTPCMPAFVPSSVPAPPRSVYSFLHTIPLTRLMSRTDARELTLSFFIANSTIYPLYERNLR